MKRHLKNLKSPGKRWSAADSYFVPPFVIPIAIGVAVLLWTILHGPVG